MYVDKSEQFESYTKATFGAPKVYINICYNIYFTNFFIGG